jgi:hypothetical protein
MTAPPRRGSGDENLLAQKHRRQPGVWNFRRKLKSGGARNDEHLL